MLTTNHGHVRPRKDGSSENCGGPEICIDCRAELLLAGNSVISADSKLVSFVPLSSVTTRGWVLFDYKRKRGAILVRGVLQIYKDKQAAYDHRDRVLPWAAIDRKD